MDTVKGAAARAIETLTGMSVTTSSVVPLKHGAEYAMPARTKEELLETQQLVADSREIPREAKKKDLADPALKIEGVQPIRNNGVVPEKKKSWLM